MTCIPGSPECSHHAVTHVFVNNPERGYGLGIDEMLAEAGLTGEKAA